MLRAGKYLLTFVPHASAMTVAATTDTILACFGSNSRAMITMGTSITALNCSRAGITQGPVAAMNVPT